MNQIGRTRQATVVALILGVWLCLGAGLRGHAQFIITQTFNNAADIQSNFANTFSGTGVTITNVTYSGANAAYGTFSSANTFGFSTVSGDATGIIIGSGNANSASGTQGGDCLSGSQSDILGTGGDPQLTNLAGATTQDATIITFSFTPNTNQVAFDYAFGSEEYPEFVSAGFNDVFGFFVTGPNPSGGNYNNLNIATLPGGAPVSIDNINAGVNSGLYIPNANCSALPGFTADAFTVGLTTQTLNVVPCSTYTMKIAVADAGDQVYNTYVLLLAKSFGGDPISGTVNSGVLGGGSTYEFCPTDLFFGFTRTTNINQPLTITYTLSGTATPGVDYTISAPNITFAPGQDNVQLALNPTADGIVEPDETVIISYIPPGSCVPFSVTAIIRDGEPTLNLPPSYCATDGPQPISFFPPAVGQVTGPGVVNNEFFPQNVGPGTYTLTLTNTPAAASCPFTKEAVVQVVNQPNVQASASPASLCASGAVTLTASGATNYTWAGPNGFTASGASVTANPTQTTTYTVTGSTGNCSATATVTVSISSNLTITAPNASVCANGTVGLSASGAVTYVWSPGTNLNDAAIPNPTFGPAPNGTYTYTVTGTDASGCTGSAVVTVTVGVGPSVSAPNAQACWNTTTTFSATSPTAVSYLWSPNTFLNNVNLQNPTFGIAPPGTYVYAVTVTDAAGCTASTNMQVSVPVIPNLIPNPTPPICPGQTTTFGIFGGSSYLWSPNTFLSNPNIVNPTFGPAPAGTYTYTVTATDGFGCTNTITITQVVSANLTITAPNASVCANATVGLSASGATGYTWSPNTFLSDPNVANPTFGPAPEGTYTYTVTGTGGNGCTGSAVVTVTVNPNLTIQATATPATLCAGQATTLTASGAGTGATYTWTSPSGPAGTGATLPLTPTATTTYTVTATAAGCTGTATVTVTVNPQPTLTINATGSSFCLGDATTPVTLTPADANTVYTITVPGNPPVTVNGTGATQVVDVPVAGLPVGNTTVTITGVKTELGCSTTATQTVTIVEIDVLNFDIQLVGSTVCENTAGTVQILGANPAITYTVEVNGTPLGAPQNGLSGNATLTIPAGSLLLGNNTVVVSGVAGSAQCQTTDTETTNITVLPDPAIAFTVSADSICTVQGATVTVTPTQPNVEYVLTLNGVPLGDTLTGDGTAQSFVIPASLTPAGGTYNYTVTAFPDVVGCVGQVSVDGSFFATPSPTVNLVALDQTACLTNDGFFVIPASVPAQLYEVFSGNTPIGGPFPGNGANLTVIVPLTFLQAGTNEVIVRTYVSGNACSPVLEDTVVITMVPAPDVASTTLVGQSVCAGQPMEVTIPNSLPGVVYTVQVGTATLAPQTGTGGALNFQLPGANLFAGTNVVSVTTTYNQFPCSLNVTKTFTVAVFAVPNPDFSLQETNACAGGLGQLTVQSQPGVSYTVFVGNNPQPIAGPVVATGTTTLIDYPASALTAGANSLTVTASAVSPDGCVGTVSKAVNVQLYPALQKPPAFFLVSCFKQPIKDTIPATVIGYTYQFYYNGAPVSAEVQGLSQFMVVSIDSSAFPTEGQYPLTLYIRNLQFNCLDSMTVGLVILPTPDAFVPEGLTVCLGQDTIVRIANAEPGVYYTLLNAFGNPVAGASDIQVSSNGDDVYLAFAGGLAVGEYTFSVEARRAGTGCKLRIPVTPKVKVLPGPGLVTVNLEPSCNDGNALAEILASEAGIIYDFILNQTDTVATFTGTGAPAATVTLNTVGRPAGTYTLVIVARNPQTGCRRVLPAPNQLIIREAPLVPEVVSALACSGGSGRVRLDTTQVGATYSLLDNGTVIVPPFAGTGQAITLNIPPAAVANGTVFNFDLRIVKGECQRLLEDYVSVQVKPLPAGPITPDGNVNRCIGSGDEVTLTAPAGPYTYQWYRNGFPIPGQNGTTLTLTETQGTGAYNVLLTDSTTGCRDSLDYLLVRFSEPAGPPAAFAARDRICAGDTTLITVLDPVFNEYRWFTAPQGGTGTLFNPTNGFSTPNLLETTTFYIEAFNFGCSQGIRTPVEVVVIPQPVAFFTASRDTTDTLYFPQSTVTFKPQVTQAVSVRWWIDHTDPTVRDSLITTLGPTDSLNYRFERPGSYLVHLIAYNELGCTDTFTLGRFWMKDVEVVVLPNAFSPNGDPSGINEFFTINLLGFDDHCIQIYDRWGRRVFDNQCNPLLHWDGRLNPSGAAVGTDPCPEGVYVYTLQARRTETNIIRKYTGTVTLLR